CARGWLLIYYAMDYW
nr:immunoglobulin heavy chain junction region [Mus musculus]